MEELAGFIPIIIIAVISAIAKSNKSSKKAQQNSSPYPWAESARPTVSQPAPPPAPAPAPVAPPQPRSASGAVRPIVHTHLAPDCDTHDAPDIGSLGFISTEGKDPCHEEQMTARSALPETQAERPGLTLDFTGDAMVKAFVMHEVLTRPCDRRR